MKKLESQMTKETYHNLTCCNVKLVHSLLGCPKTIVESNLLISHIKYCFPKSHYFYFKSANCRLWQYEMSSLQGRETKLDKVLDKNQHIQGKLFYIVNGRSAKISKSAKI